MSQVAIGFRVHLGWAAAVSITGPVKEPGFVDRRRLELTDAAVPESHEPYHAGEGLPLRDAGPVVERGVRAARRAGLRALRELIGALEADGHQVIATGMLTGAGRPWTKDQKLAALVAWLALPR